MALLLGDEALEVAVERAPAAAQLEVEGGGDRLRPVADREERPARAAVAVGEVEGARRADRAGAELRLGRCRDRVTVDDVPARRGRIAGVEVLEEELHHRVRVRSEERRV